MFKEEEKERKNCRALVLADTTLPPDTNGTFVLPPFPLLSQDEPPPTLYGSLNPVTKPNWFCEDGRYYGHFKVTFLAPFILS